VTVERIPETVVPGRRLGRHLNHDPRSRRFAATPEPVLRSVTHRLWGPVLDQYKVGACTTHALAHALNSSPLHVAGRPLLRGPDALRLYGITTGLDPYEGTYPPDDTGSDGNSACKAARQEGLLAGWEHAFTLEQALSALVRQAVIVGTVWTGGMDEPDSAGFLRPKTGRYRGGHEYALIGLDVKRRTVTMVNSWSSRWGANGRARITWDDLEWLLGQEGDLTVPLV
jgi:hypothetical protein